MTALVKMRASGGPNSVLLAYHTMEKRGHRDTLGRKVTERDEGDGISKTWREAWDKPFPHSLEKEPA